MQRRFALLSALSFGLFACAAAPNPAPVSAPSTVTVDHVAAAPIVVAAKPPPERISLAAVVKQVAPEAKSALVFGGGRELIADLSRVGISADVVSETPAHDCLRDLSKRADVVVVDGDIAWDCRQNGMLVVSRASRKVADLQSRNEFVDARCTADVCDVFSLSEEEPHRWFVPGDLPLTLVHAHLTANAPTRTAFGVIVGDTLDLGGTSLAGTTRVRIDGTELHGGRASRDVLEGWWPDAAREALPREIDGIAQVEGSVRLEGSLGLGSIHFPPWQRPTDAPDVFSSLTSTATLATMTSGKLGLVLPGPMLARLNGMEDAELARATAAIKKGDIGPATAAVHRARTVLHAGLAFGEDFGRARFLGTLDDRLTSGAPFELAEAFLAARPQAGAQSERTFAAALYERACVALTPLVDGPDAEMARKAADVAWKMYVERSMSPQPVHERAFKRFGAPKG